jgi:hypothetical protein
MLNLIFVVFVTLLCGVSDGEYFYQMLSEPFDARFEMECYEAGSFFYVGPTVTTCSNNTKVINWDTMTGRGLGKYLIEWARIPT